MLAFQGKTGIVVIEIGEAILTIMADQAILSKFQDMLLDEIWAFGLMAVNAVADGY